MSLSVFEGVSALVCVSNDLMMSRFNVVCCGQVEDCLDIIIVEILQVL